MAEKPKLLFHSNNPMTGTGYGQQSALFGPKLAEHFELTYSAYYGNEGYVASYKGIPILPGIGQTHGDQTIEAHADKMFEGDLRGGLVVTLMDVWVLDPRVWSQFNVASWCPVDHDPVPRPVHDFFINSGAIPIAMSKFGREMLADLDPLYVPHAVDTKVYKPDPEARETVGLPEDKFIVGMVAANKGNPSRKCFQEAFEAFKLFHDKHPDAVLYMHTEATGRFGGVNLPGLLDAIGVPRDAVIWTDQYRMLHLPHSAETMASMFASLDVLLAPSAGEGFGVPVIEAQSCGVPVIVSDFSAQPELVGAGWLVDGTRHYTPIASWQFRPSVPDIVEALGCAYRERSNPTVAKKARKKGLEYDIEHVMERYMLPALKEAQERFDERKPVEIAA